MAERSRSRPLPRGNSVSADSAQGPPEGTPPSARPLPTTFRQYHTLLVHLAGLKGSDCVRVDVINVSRAVWFPQSRAGDRRATVHYMIFVVYHVRGVASLGRIWSGGRPALALPRACVLWYTGVAQGYPGGYRISEGRKEWSQETSRGFVLPVSRSVRRCVSSTRVPERRYLSIRA